MVLFRVREDVFLVGCVMDLSDQPRADDGLAMDYARRHSPRNSWIFSRTTCGKLGSRPCMLTTFFINLTTSSRLRVSAAAFAWRRSSSVTSRCLYSQSLGWVPWEMSELGLPFKNLCFLRVNAVKADLVNAADLLIILLRKSRSDVHCLLIFGGRHGVLSTRR